MTVLLFSLAMANHVRLAEGNEASAASPEPLAADYSKFTHTNPQHARLPCLLCHRREDNSPQPKRSLAHLPCSGCHSQEFNNSSSPMCTICHVSNGSKELKAFPRAKSFDAKFNHAVHSRGGARPANGCVTCHKPANRGVAKSFPTGFSAHNTCFQCHTPQAKSGDKDISSCATCHVLGSPSRPSMNAKAYRVNFSHDKHARRMNCTDCHTTSAGRTGSPNPTMHNNSGRGKNCSTCHNNTRAFGADDFANCKRCHTGTTFRFR